MHGTQISNHAALKRRAKFRSVRVTIIAVDKQEALGIISV